MDRMLGHATGMIGFPLRLLARENYDRVVKLKGARAVALITGEEKIIPANPRYFVCTVESMPVDRDVAFLAIDEIQLAADRDRGHVFTDRLLHARGRIETMFLGAETIKPLIRKLVPQAQFITRPRSSCAGRHRSCADRRPRRSSHERRHVWHYRRSARDRSRRRDAGGEPRVPAAADDLLAQHRSAVHLGRCAAGLAEGPTADAR